MKLAGDSKGNRRIVADEEEAEIVRACDAKILEGWSQRRVLAWAQKMSPRAWKSRRGISMAMQDEDNTCVNAGIRSPETQSALRALSRNHKVKYGTDRCGRLRRDQRPCSYDGSNSSRRPCTGQLWRHRSAKFVYPCHPDLTEEQARNGFTDQALAALGIEWGLQGPSASATPNRTGKQRVRAITQSRYAPGFGDWGTYRGMSHAKAPYFRTKVCAACREAFETPAPQRITCSASCRKKYWKFRKGRLASSQADGTTFDLPEAAEGLDPKAPNQRR